MEDSARITDDVVHAARAGEPWAFRVIYDELAGVVCGYLRAKGASDPEGLTSEVFLGVLPRLRNLTGGAAGLRRLVFSIAHARMVDDHRERSRQPVITEFDPAADPRSDVSAEDRAAVSLGTSRVLEVLDLLPDDQREVLALRVVADLSLEQVAQVMNRSVGAVKQLQRRGLVMLRRTLGEWQVTL